MSVLKNDFSYIISNLSQSEKEKLKNTTLLITGCCGFIGYYLLHFFQSIGEDFGIKKVIGIDNFILGEPKWIFDIQKDNRFVIKKKNISDFSSIEANDYEEADFVIHMASIASPIFYRKYPIDTVDANVWGLRNLLDFYKVTNLKGFLYFSTSEIYGDPPTDKIPTKEDYRGNVSCVGPRACYDESKRFCETLCMLYAQKYHMPIGVVRPFNNYGPGMKINDKRVIADFARAVLEHKTIEIFSSGKPTRTFCYIADATIGYLKVLLHGQYNYFNIGIEKPEISIEKLACIVANMGEEVFNYKPDIIYAKSEDQHYLTHNPERRCPNVEKAKKKLGYLPKIEIEEGIKRYLQFLKESPATEYLW